MKSKIPLSNKSQITHSPHTYRGSFVFRDPVNDLHVLYPCFADVHRHRRYGSHQATDHAGREVQNMLSLK